MLKASAALVAALLVAPAASAGPRRVPLRRATRMTMRSERRALGLPARRIRLRCWEGRRGNVGCVYQACVYLPSLSGNDNTSSFNLRLGHVVVTGSAGVTWRHGRLRVLDAGWLSLHGACGHAR